METAILLSAIAGLFTALINERMRHDKHLSELEQRHNERMLAMESRIFDLVENIIEDKVEDTKKLSPEQVEKIKRKIEENDKSKIATDKVKRNENSNSHSANGS